MKLTLILAILVLLVTPARSFAPKVKTGIDVLEQRHFDILQGKRVGLITNPTGVNSRLRSTIDILSNAEGVRLVALFGPEHGVRGDTEAGGNVASTTDRKTGIPVYSLYSNRTHKPSNEMLKGIDILVYDIQDIGVRSYTYISILGLAMEAAAERGIGFVVLDRPNPLGGIRIEGNLPDAAVRSSVCAFPIPYVYGLTCGELASMLNGEGMLENGVRCSLTVVPMQGWERSMTFKDTGLEWVPTSPHVPEASTSPYLVGTGILGELNTVNIGVGYTIPFRTFAASWIDPDSMAERMNALQRPGVLFRPIRYKPFYGTDQGKTLGGVELYITDQGQAQLMSLQFLFLQVHHTLYPAKNPFAMAGASRIRMFDTVLGTDAIRVAFERTMSYAAIEPLLSIGVEAFREHAQHYWLYSVQEK